MVVVKKLAAEDVVVIVPFVEAAVVNSVSTVTGWPVVCEVSFTYSCVILLFSVVSSIVVVF